MSQKLPLNVAHEVKQKVFDLADEHRYMEKTRNQNAVFLANLIAHPEVGRVIAEFIPREDIKTYIKDAILNRYAKIKTHIASDLDSLLTQPLGEPCHLVANINSQKITLHRTTSGKIAIVSRGTLLKWETALRKLLIYLAQASAQDKSLTFVRLLALSGGLHVNSAEKENIESALCTINVKVLWV